MLEWISRHSNILSVITNAGMLVVWLVYAQILLSSFLRQRKPRVIINRGRGRDLDAEIMVSNMSQEAVLILCLQAVIETDSGSFVRTVTDVRSHDEHDPAGKTYPVTSQGPLASGSYMRLGSFRKVAEWASPGAEHGEAWRTFGIRVIFLYGSEDHPICAYRHFALEDEDSGMRVRPLTLDTPELRSRRHRRRIERWLQESA